MTPDWPLKTLVKTFYSLVLIYVYCERRASLRSIRYSYRSIDVANRQIDGVLYFRFSVITRDLTFFLYFFCQRTFSSYIRLVPCYCMQDSNWPPETLIVIIFKRVLVYVVLWTRSLQQIRSSIRFVSPFANRPIFSDHTSFTVQWRY